MLNYLQYIVCLF